MDSSTLYIEGSLPDYIIPDEIEYSFSFISDHLEEDTQQLATEQNALADNVLDNTNAPEYPTSMSIQQQQPKQELNDPIDHTLRDLFQSLTDSSCQFKILDTFESYFNQEEEDEQHYQLPLEQSKPTTVQHESKANFTMNRQLQPIQQPFQRQSSITSLDTSTPILINSNSSKNLLNLAQTNTNSIQHDTKSNITLEHTNLTLNPSAIFSEHLKTSNLKESCNQSSFDCHKCEKSFVDKHSVHKHIWQVHPNQLFNCVVSWCGVKVKTFGHLLEHYSRKVHRGVNFPCDQCKILGKTKDLMVDHLRIYHQIDFDPPINKFAFDCPKCDKSFRTKVSVTDHLRRVHPKGLFNCEVIWCCKEFKTNHDLSRHYRSVHKGVNFPCGRCKMLRNRNDLMVNHLRTYHQIEFDVEQQKHQINESTNLNSAINVNSNENCDNLDQSSIASFDPSIPILANSNSIEDKTVGDIGQLDLIPTEILLPTNEYSNQYPKNTISPLDQSTSNQSYPISSLQSNIDLNQPNPPIQSIQPMINLAGLNKLTSQSPFKCSECNKFFRNQRTFGKHIHAVHPKILQLCVVSGCCKKFKRRNHLLIHYRKMHKGVNIPCDQCKMFRNRNDLMVHLQTRHSINFDNQQQQDKEAELSKSTNQSVNCPECAKSFKNKRVLYGHTQLAHPEQLYTCEVSWCGQKNQSNMNLNCHYRHVHKGVNFPCSQCPMYRNSKDLMADHLRAYHQIEFDVERQKHQIIELNESINANSTLNTNDNENCDNPDQSSNTSFDASIPILLNSNSIKDKTVEDIGQLDSVPIEVMLPTNQNSIQYPNNTFSTLDPTISNQSYPIPVQLNFHLNHPKLKSTSNQDNEPSNIPVSDPNSQSVEGTVSDKLDFDGLKKLLSENESDKTLVSTPLLDFITHQFNQPTKQLIQKPFQLENEIIICKIFEDDQLDAKPDGNKQIVNEHRADELSEEKDQNSCPNNCLDHAQILPNNFEIQPVAYAQQSRCSFAECVDLTFNHLPSLLRHTRLKHPESLNPLHLKSLRNVRRAKQSNHVLKFGQASKHFKCSQCDKSFKNQVILKIHVERIHATLKMFSCEFNGCTRTFESDKELNRRRGVHYRGERKRQIQTSNDLQVNDQPSEHVIGLKESDNKFIYKDVSNELHRKLEFNHQKLDNQQTLHQLTELNKSTNQSSLHCQKCDKTFSNKMQHYRHLHTVHPKQLHPCQVSGCGKKFKIKGNLFRHYREVHKGINFPCSQCKRSRNIKMVEHLQTYHHIDFDLHKKGLSVKCPKCNKFFKNKKSLTGHLWAVQWTVSTPNNRTPVKLVGVARCSKLKVAFSSIIAKCTKESTFHVASAKC